jgi:hypothetical protein
MQPGYGGRLRRANATKHMQEMREESEKAQADQTLHRESSAGPLPPGGGVSVRK